MGRRDTKRAEKRGRGTTENRSYYALPHCNNALYQSRYELSQIHTYLKLDTSKPTFRTTTSMLRILLIAGFCLLHKQGQFNMRSCYVSHMMIIFPVNAANNTCCLGWDSCSQTCETDHACLTTSHHIPTENGKVAYGCDGILGVPEICGDFLGRGCTSFKTGKICCCYGDRQVEVVNESFPLQ